jgi:hypothetical protein
MDLLKHRNALKFSRNAKGQLLVFDIVRRKNVVVQPEELVRQMVVHHLISDQNYPLSKMRVEMGLKVNDRQKRCDILVFDAVFQPFLLVECKAANVPIDQSVFEQIARYNLVFKVPFLMVTNGLSTFICQMFYPDAENTEGGWELLESLPFWS